MNTLENRIYQDIRNASEYHLQVIIDYGIFNTGDEFAESLLKEYSADEIVKAFDKISKKLIKEAY